MSKSASLLLAAGAFAYHTVDVKLEASKTTQALGEGRDELREGVLVRARRERLALTGREAAGLDEAVQIATLLVGRDRS